MMEAVDMYGRKLKAGDVVIVSAGGTSVAEFGVYSHSTEKRLMVKMPGSYSRPFYWTQKSPATVCKFVPELAQETIDKMKKAEEEHQD
jgi:hypothetical protein